jgi:hypothetical protein
LTSPTQRNAWWSNRPHISVLCPSPRASAREGPDDFNTQAAGWHEPNREEFDEGDQTRAALIMTAEQMLTLVTARALVLWSHVDRAAAERGGPGAPQSTEPDPFSDG